jgi:hypothetical protein
MPELMLGPVNLRNSAADYLPWRGKENGLDSRFTVWVPQRPNLVPRRTSGKLVQRSPALWFDPGAYVAPTPGMQGTVTRNVLRGPGTVEFDFSALKNFAVSERLTAQFRAEAFNIINHPNFGNPDANISNTNAGSITTFSFDNRDLQFALKLLW